MQAAWVRIVELIAAAITQIDALIAKIPTIPNPLEKGGVLSWSLPGMAMRGMDALAGPKPEELSREEALAAAKRRLQAGMKPESTFDGRWSQMINDLKNPPKGEKAAEEVKKVTTEFDRLERSMERSAAALEADARTVGLSAGEHARMRVELRLLEAAQHDGITVTDEYAARIKKIADRTGEATQALALARVQQSIKFENETMFFSETDKKIAQQLVPIYWDLATAMNSAAAAQLRLTRQIKADLEPPPAKAPRRPQKATAKIGEQVHEFYPSLKAA